MNDISNGSRDDRFSASQIFRRLGRTDVACRLVASERQHRDVPTGKVVRQLAIWFWSQVMNVWVVWQRLGLNLHRRSEEHEVQVRTHRGDRRDKIAIESLIDYSKKANPRC